MESHELRLIINAAAAKAGGKQFVAAIRQVQDAVKSLDRDTAGSFTTLKKESAAAGKAASAAAKEVSASAKASTTAAKAAAGATRTQATEAQRAQTLQLQLAAAMRSATLETERLKARLLRAGDAAGATAVTQALIALRAQTANGVTSTLQLRAAMGQFSDATNRSKIALTQKAAAQAQATAAARALASAEKTAADAARRVEADMRSAAGAANAANASFKNAAGGMRGLENSMNLGYQAASAFRVAIGSITLGTFTSAVFQAGDALQQFLITMEVASGSVSAANSDLEFINEMASRLGTNLGAARDAFSKFAVSAQIAGVETAQTREIFESVSTAMAVLGRGADDQRLAFLALEQMMSKGVISAEELRRQLGERLPGAVNLMARAVGVSTQELQKMLKAGELISSEVLPKFAEELNKTFGSQIERTFNRAGSNLGRMQVEFQKLLEIVAQSGFLDTLASEFRDLTTLLRSDDAKDAARRIGEGMADAAQIVSDAASYIITNFNQIADVAKTVFGALLIRQFFLAGQAVTMFAQQSLVAVTGMKSLSGAFLGTKGAATAATVATTAAGKTIVTLGTSATATAASVTRVGTALGVAGRVFGALAGPIGLAISALTLVPLLFSDASNSADSASIHYEEAMRRMDAANFSFISTAREIGDLTVFEQLNNNVLALTEARKVITDLTSSADLVRDLGSSFTDLEEATRGGAASGDVTSIRSLVNDLLLMDKTTPEAVAQVQKIQAAMNELNGTGRLSENAFSSMREVDEILRPLAQAILTQNGLMTESSTIAGANGVAYAELAARQQELVLAQQAVIEGTRDITAFTDETSSAFVGLGDGAVNGLVAQMGTLSQSLTRISNFNGSGVLVNGLVNDLQNLQFTFDGTEGSIDEYSAMLEEARAKAEQVANDDSLPRHLRRSAEAALETISEAENYVTSLLNVQAQSADTAAAQDSLAAGVAAAGNTMAGSTAAAYDYAAALAVVGQAQAAVSGVTTDFRAQAQRRVELSTLEGEARAVFQDRYFGTTNRAVGEIDAAIAEARTALEGFEGTPQDGAAEYMRRQLAGLTAERNAIVSEGEAATRAIFSNNEDRRESSRSTGGSRGGSSGGQSDAAKAIEEERKAYENAEKALGDYIIGLTEESAALALVAEGRASSTDAATLLIEAQKLGVVTSQEQADAFLTQAAAAERLKETLEELANDSVNEWVNSVPSWIEAGQMIEKGAIESVSSALSNMLKTGEFSLRELGLSIVDTAIDIVSDKAVKSLLGLLGGNMSGEGEGGFGLGGILGGLFGGADDSGPNSVFGSSGEGEAAAIQNALTTGGTQVAQMLQQALINGGQQLSSGIQQGSAQGAVTTQQQIQAAHAVGGQQAGQRVIAAHSQGGTSVSVKARTAMTSGATRLGQGVVQGARQGAPILAQGVASGAGGSGGGTGFFSELFGSALSFLPFAEGGLSSAPTSANKPITAPASLMKHAPQFSQGTANTSGIPAMLHDNEAVIPLSKGRKIPVEMNGQGGGGNASVVNQNITIQTPNVREFNNSRTQIGNSLRRAAAQGQKND